MYVVKNLTTGAMYKGYELIPLLEMALECRYSNSDRISAKWIGGAK